MGTHKALRFIRNGLFLTLALSSPTHANHGDKLSGVLKNILALNPSLPPSSNFNLSTWKLTLPTPIGGIGEAQEIKNPMLVSGYTNPPYFYTGESGSMNFWTPANGATTQHSIYPRCELLEEWNGENSTWSISQFTSHVLTSSMLISKVPRTGLMVIAQIHDNGTTDPYGNKVKNKPLFKLFYSTKQKDPNGNPCNGCISAEIRPTPISEMRSQLYATIVNHLPLNTLFTYTVRLENTGKLSVSVNDNVQTYRVNLSKNNFHGWGSQQFYFRAGAYIFDNALSSTDGGEVNVYYLHAQHS